MGLWAGRAPGARASRQARATPVPKSSGAPDPRFRAPLPPKPTSCATRPVEPRVSGLNCRGFRKRVTSWVAARRVAPAVALAGLCKASAPSGRPAGPLGRSARTHTAWRRRASGPTGSTTGRQRRPSGRPGGADASHSPARATAGATRQAATHELSGAIFACPAAPAVRPRGDTSRKAKEDPSTSARPPLDPYRGHRGTLRKKSSHVLIRIKVYTFPSMSCSFREGVLTAPRRTAGVAGQARIAASSRRGPRGGPWGARTLNENTLEFKPPRDWCAERSRLGGKGFVVANGFVERLEFTLFPTVLKHAGRRPSPSPPKRGKAHELRNQSVEITRIGLESSGLVGVQFHLRGAVGREAAA